MKAKRILSTLVILLSIVFLMNNAAFAGNLDDLRRAIKDAIAKHAEDEGDVASMETSTLPIMPIKRIIIPGVPCVLTIEHVSPEEGYIFRGNGTGTITVYSPTAITVKSNNPDVKITACKFIYTDHYLVSYSVTGPSECWPSEYATITIFQSGTAFLCKKSVKIYSDFYCM
jgi:hypothetical protein